MDREDGFDDESVNKEWDALLDDGFDITVLIGNGDPFNTEEPS